MIFSTPEFFIFFGVVLLLLSVFRRHNFRKAILLGASYFFYGYWDWRFTFLMAGMTLVNYYLGQAISTYRQHKTTFLTVAIAFDLAVLGFFKYYNFFVDSANIFANQFGVSISHLDVILPVGISFITFLVIAYVVDIHQEVTESAGTLQDFALLVAFFPHLVAGPILRAKQFLPEIQKQIVFTRANFIIGGQRFLLGFFRKVMIADRLALFVDTVFATPQAYSGPTIWLAVLAYTIQIYCDFAGYSDMAIGIAKCMGYEIPMNFDLPYISRSITEFWRRWHISLSTWLKEYLYFPLGGNRKGQVRQYLNLMIVMLLGGLWHGASWNFVIWGGLHGLALGIHKFYATRVKTMANPYLNLPQWLYNGLTWLITLLFVCLTWVFFRSPNFSSSLIILQKMFVPAQFSGLNWYATAMILAVPGLILSDFLGSVLDRGFQLKLNTFGTWFWLSFWLLGFLFLAPHNPQPFVYFQF